MPTQNPRFKLKKVEDEQVPVVNPQQSVTETMKAADEAGQAASKNYSDKAYAAPLKPPARRGGFEQYYMEQAATSRGKGSSTMVNGRYVAGPFQGMTEDQAMSKARQDYSAMPDQNRLAYEKNANMEDVRSDREMKLAGAKRTDQLLADMNKGQGNESPYKVPLTSPEMPMINPVKPILTDNRPKDANGQPIDVKSMVGTGSTVELAGGGKATFTPEPADQKGAQLASGRVVDRGELQSRGGMINGQFADDANKSMENQVIAQGGTPNNTNFKAPITEPNPEQKLSNSGGESPVLSEEEKRKKRMSTGA